MDSTSLYEDNPFQTLITEAGDDPSRYETHRVNRNAQQTAKILAEDFPGWNLDTILRRLEGPNKEEGFVDPRNCLVIWAKPPPPVRDLITFVQTELHKVAPALWLMPTNNLHTTILEVAHSQTPEQIETLASTLLASKEVSPQQIADYTYTHRTRLLRPMVSFDSSAMALSFAPAAGEGGPNGNLQEEDGYSYHHLRRDVCEMVRKAGIPVASRYVVPSAHLTIARFINQDGFLAEGATGEEEGKQKMDQAQVKALIEKIEEINQRLRDEYWPRDDGSIPAGGEWRVGEERGLVIARGRLWYGNGEFMASGRGY